MKTKMKIAHFITYYLPVTQNWIYTQLVHNDECESYVLCQRLIDPARFPFGDVYPICRTSDSGVSNFIKRVNHKVFEQYQLEPHLSTIQKIKPDILHGHFLLESWRNYRLIKKLNIPLVTTCYGQDITSLPRKLFWKDRCKKVFDLSSAFIVEGKHMGKTLEALGCPSEKIHVIKLGVDIEKIKPSNHNKIISDNNVNDKNSDDKIIRILFTGLSREKKGAIYAAQAFALASKILHDKNRDNNPNNNNIKLELHILGDGIYRNTIEKILTDANVIQNTTFHGMQPLEKYYDLLNTTDLVLAPSVHAKDGDTEGGAPVVVIEALCAKVPVVASDHCDIPNIVKHGESGLISNERDVSALARDIVTLSENEKLRLSMGESGAKYVREEHDIGNQIKKKCKIYESVKIKRT